jgi:hypothetical protein
MSSDRLKELQRQRAHAQEQVAWFDREIAREQSLAAPVQPVGKPSSPPSAGGVPAPREAIKSPAISDIRGADAAGIEMDADRLIEKYRDPKRSVHGEFWRGCAIYLIGAVVLVLLVIGAVRVLNRLLEHFF